MKTLSVVGMLILGLAVAWASFAPQAINAAQLVGGCGGGPGPGTPIGNCSGQTTLNCKTVATDCCNNLTVTRCEYNTPMTKICYEWATPCSGGGNCVYATRQECQ
jgi:hypothetical protein